MTSRTWCCPLNFHKWRHKNYLYESQFPICAVQLAEFLIKYAQGWPQVSWQQKQQAKCSPPDLIHQPLLSPLPGLEKEEAGKAEEEMWTRSGLHLHLDIYNACWWWVYLPLHRLFLPPFLPEKATTPVVVALTATCITSATSQQGSRQSPNAGSNGLPPVLEVPFSTFCNRRTGLGP